MNNKKKVIIKSMLIAIFFYQFAVVNCLCVEASEVNKIITAEDGTNIETNFNFEKASLYEQSVIEYEAKKTTGVIDSKIEESLNYAGVPDEVIKSYDSESIKRCNNENNIYVSVEYCDVSENSMEKMTTTERENYFKKYCKKHNIPVLKKKRKGWLTNLTNPVIVKAEMSDVDSYKTSGGKFMHILTTFTTKITEEKKKKKAVYYTYRAKWLSEPYYLSTDIFGIIVDNGKIISSDKNYPLKGEMLYTNRIEHYGIFNAGTNKSYTTKSISPIFKKIGTNSCVIYKEDLPGTGGLTEDYARSLAMQNGGSACYYDDITFIVTGYAKKSSSSVADVCINAYYWHEESTISISTSFSFNGTSISLGLSAKQEKVMNMLGSGIDVSVDKFK